MYFHKELDINMYDFHTNAQNIFILSLAANIQYFTVYNVFGEWTEFPRE